MCIDSSETIVLNKYVTWKSEKKKQKKKKINSPWPFSSSSLLSFFFFQLSCFCCMFVSIEFPVP